MRAGDWQHIRNASCEAKDAAGKSVCGAFIEVWEVQLPWPGSRRVTLRICPRCDQLRPVPEGEPA